MNSELSFLVVEDDPIDAKAVCKLLGRGPTAQHTDRAASLEQAKEKVRQSRYDAVILDLGLPDSQGIDGLIEFQASAPELPVVVLTGCQDENIALRSMDLGAEDFLNKNSMTEDSLWRSLRYAIERHRRKREVYQDIDSLRVSLNDAMRQATSDPLTTLPNRRGLQNYLEQLSKAHPQQPFIVGVTDLDHFKNINDSYGHHVGDIVLREFAGRLQHCMRSVDFVARIGGDEFVIIFGGLKRAEAENLGRRMMDHVSSSPISEAGRKINFSATLAIAEIEPPFIDLEQILLQTHRLLVQGKEGGRNRVECAWSADSEESKKTGALETKDQEPRTHEFSDSSLVQHARAVRTLALDGSLGYHILFGLGSPTWPMVAPAVSRSRLANRLSEMTLNCVQRAQKWRQHEAPHSQLHLDIEADAIRPWVCAKLTHIFPQDEDRANCVFFLHTDFHNQPGAASLADIRLLHQAGFQIGVRNIGDGATILEHLQLLAPEWIRFDPALTVHVGRYEKKAAALRQTIKMLQPLNAHFLADETEETEDLKLLQALGFNSYYSSGEVPRGSLNLLTQK
jgi:diguanylate cyclase (GGDEF)-like protein